MRTAVVGGGLTGLVAARELAGSGHDVVLVEAADRFGGVVRTVRRDGFLIETGPESFVTRKPALLGLCRELGLEEEVVYGRVSSRASVYARGALRSFPAGGVFLPTRLRPLLSSGILSPLETLRVAADLVLPAGGIEGDATLGRVVGGRLGRAALDRLVAPLAAGIYGADPDRMSLAATFPEVLDAARRGSLLRPAGRSRGRGDPPVPPFATLRGGLQALVDRLVEDRRGAELLAGVQVDRVVREREEWRLEIRGRSAIRAERLLLAVPAAEAARILAAESPAVARLLAAFRRVSTVVVTFAWDAGAVAVPDGNGFVVARDAGLPITACTFSSSKWPGRAPDGRVLVRVYLGRADDPLDRGMSDEELIRRARAGLESATGWSAPPILSRVDRAEDAMPQYDVGHLDRVAEVERALGSLPGVAVAGADYRGVGLADCAAQGRAAARRLIGYHGTRERGGHPGRSDARWGS
ncbi:MAG TPA: protoporphyrinogen oxidase [Gemmatimonadota bacterium]|nr:protoporphyrinogen oxidase [Gemmatimonadota bacterium]